MSNYKIIIFKIDFNWGTKKNKSETVAYKYIKLNDKEDWSKSSNSLSGIKQTSLFRLFKRWKNINNLKCHVHREKETTFNLYIERGTLSRSIIVYYLNPSFKIAADKLHMTFAKKKNTFCHEPLFCQCIIVYPMYIFF